MFGGSVTTQNVVNALAAIHNGHGPRDIVVVYFSGHGQHGPQGRDLNLILNDGSEMPLTRWVREARGGKTREESSYKGKLIFILDA